MSGDPTVFALPVLLEFDKPRGGVLDKDGQGTGFTWIQDNKNATEYQPSLIDLSPGEGLLKITSSGNATNGGNFGADNTLTNGLQVTFNAQSKAWTMVAPKIIGEPHARLNLAAPIEARHLRIAIVEKDGWQPWVIKELNLFGDEGATASH